MLGTIDKLAFICIHEGKLLLARSKGQDTYYIPGGKREAGETDLIALSREVKEELSVDLRPETIKFMGMFAAQAHGKPEGVMVQMSCYAADYTGALSASAEIEEIRWVHYRDVIKCSQVTQSIMDWLSAHSLIKPVPLHGIYKYVLFDADNTLFRFNDFEGLKIMFAELGVEFTTEDFEKYQKINRPLWVEYQQGKISAKEIQEKRFEAWASKLGRSAEELNNRFLEVMVCNSPLLSGAESLLRLLKAFDIKVVILTNGFTKLHQRRVEYAGIAPYIDHLVVSEAVGVAKPDPRIFDHALGLLGHPSKNQVLMVGDTLESDIKGGMISGLDTCWLSAEDTRDKVEILPVYKVASLVELQALFGGSEVVVSAAADVITHEKAIGGAGVAAAAIWFAGDEGKALSAAAAVYEY